MKMKKTIFFALLCILSVSLVYADNNQSMESDQMIKKAQATNKIAIKLKNEWRDTRKLIKSAKKAHANKDYAKALELAEEALNQATMAVEQHNSQKDKYRFFCCVALKIENFVLIQELRDILQEDT